ncbi:hypothetical protein SK128_026416 [Halocaridina rubra]|uniref:Uncharacterized protein n=1 Tax=Halocaridina rubra TaxID=373956 RepID=A0AAN8WHH9_HALRR
MADYSSHFMSGHCSHIMTGNGGHLMPGPGTHSMGGPGTHLMGGPGTHLMAGHGGHMMANPTGHLMTGQRMEAPRHHILEGPTTHSMNGHRNHSMGGPAVGTHQMENLNTHSMKPPNMHIPKAPGNQPMAGRTPSVSTSPKSKRAKCHICGKEVYDNSKLKRHLLIHSGIKDFKCTLCEKAFYDNRALKKHMIVHSGRKDYKCTTCNKAFNDQRNFKRHMHLHTGIKDFKCDMCDKRFALKFHLKLHRDTHNKKLIYQCDICKKKFSQMRYMRGHRLLHTKNPKKLIEKKKDFKCETCGKAFLYERYFKRHISLHVKREKELDTSDLRKLLKLCGAKTSGEKKGRADARPESYNNLVKLKWTKESKFALIELVQARPILWNTKDPKFHKKSIRQQNYEAIASTLKTRYPELFADMNGEHVHQKFKNIRAYFQRQFKKLQEAPTNTEENQPDQKWPYMEACMFMSDEPTDTFSSLPLPAPPEQTMCEGSESVNIPDDTMTEEEITSIASSLFPQPSSANRGSSSPDGSSSDDSSAKKMKESPVKEEDIPISGAKNLSQLVETVVAKLGHTKQQLLAAKIISAIQEVTKAE